MSKEELSFEELSDGSKIITIKGINRLGEKYIRQDRIKCPAVWDALKRLTYTAEEMEAFAEWTAIIQWIYDPTDKCWFQKHSTETKTTAQLRELWEVWKLAQQRCNGGCCDNGTGYCMFCKKKLI